MKQTVVALAVSDKLADAKINKAVDITKHVRVSKHRTAPYFGMVILGQWSGLRKRMRAAARGILPMTAPPPQAAKYLNSSARLVTVGII